jgi:hypothetical protein
MITLETTLPLKITVPTALEPPITELGTKLTDRMTGTGVISKRVVFTEFELFVDALKTACFDEATISVETPIEAIDEPDAIKTLDIDSLTSTISDQTCTH